MESCKYKLYIKPIEGYYDLETVLTRTVIKEDKASQELEEKWKVCEAERKAYKEPKEFRSVYDKLNNIQKKMRRKTNRKKKKRRK